MWCSVRWIYVWFFVGVVSWYVCAYEGAAEDGDKWIDGLPVYRPRDEAVRFLGGDAFGEKATHFYALRADNDRVGNYREVMYIRYDVDPNGVRELGDSFASLGLLNKGPYSQKRMDEFISSFQGKPNWWEEIIQAEGRGEYPKQNEGYYLNKNKTLWLFIAWRHVGNDIRVYLRVMKIRKIEGKEAAWRWFQLDLPGSAREVHYSIDLGYGLYINLLRFDIDECDLGRFLSENTVIQECNSITDEALIRMRIKKGLVFPKKEWWQPDELNNVRYMEEVSNKYLYVLYGNSDDQGIRFYVMKKVFLAER